MIPKFQAVGLTTLSPPRPSRLGSSQRRAGLGVWACYSDPGARERLLVAKAAGTDPGEFAGAVASLIRQWSPTLPPGTVVTVPPPGASTTGPYFASALASAVASNLGLAFVEALGRTTAKRWHHPQESVRQGEFVLTGPAPAFVLVVDDLITSGTTMRRSLSALRSAGSVAFGFSYAGT